MFLQNYFKRVFSLGSVVDVAKKSRFLGNSALYIVSKTR